MPFNPDKHVSSRVRPGDLKEAMVTLNKEKEVTSNQIADQNLVGIFTIRDRAEIWMDINGQEVEQTEGYPALSNDKGDNRIFAFAKLRRLNGRDRFYIKRDSSGHLLNPFGGLVEFRHMKEIKKAGRAEFEFKEVNKKVFTLYLNFLKTLNIAWLNNAERELF